MIIELPNKISVFKYPTPFTKYYEQQVESGKIKVYYEKGFRYVGNVRSIIVKNDVVYAKIFDALWDTLGTLDNIVKIDVEEK